MQTKLHRAAVLLLTAMIVGCATIGAPPPAPEVTLEAAGTTSYISPGASQGTKDRFTSGFQTSPPEGEVIEEYHLSVTDEAGTEVYGIDRNTDQGSVFGIADDSVTTPNTVTWDATNNTGEPVAEGRYFITVRVVDSADTDASSGRAEVVIDNTPPSADVTAALAAFSPDDNGRDDELPLTQTSEAARQWTGRVVRISQDSVIFETSWEDRAPEQYAWDGRTGRGEIASPGRYRYELVGRDQAGNRVTARTEPFRLDLDVTELSLSVGPDPFTPDGDGRNDTARFALDASDRTSVTQWRVSIYDPADNLFYRTSGEAVPDEPITWDGRDDDGELVQAGRDYAVEARVTDAAGNRSTTEVTLNVGILVTQEPDGDYRIRVNGIFFVPFEADYQNLEDPERVEHNMRVLDRLAEILAEFEDQPIVIEGHAVHVTTGEEARRREQETRLLPLSRARAEAIKDALVGRGISAERMTTTGVGGNEPIVPHTNEDERWKNRRVEFEVRRDS